MTAAREGWGFRLFEWLGRLVAVALVPAAILVWTVGDQWTGELLGVMTFLAVVIVAAIYIASPTKTRKAWCFATIGAAVVSMVSLLVMVFLIPV